MSHSISDLRLRIVPLLPLLISMAFGCASNDTSPPTPGSFGYKSQLVEIHAVEVQGFKRSGKLNGIINPADSGAGTQTMISTDLTIDHGHSGGSRNKGDTIYFENSYRAPDSSYSSRSKTILDRTKGVIKSASITVGWRGDVHDGRSYAGEEYVLTLQNIPFTLSPDGVMRAEVHGEELLGKSVSLKQTTSEYYSDTGNEIKIEYRRIVHSPNSAYIKLSFMPPPP